MKFAVALLCVSLAAVKDAVQGRTRKHNTHANCCGSVGCKQDRGTVGTVELGWWWGGGDQAPGDYRPTRLSFIKGSGFGCVCNRGARRRTKGPGQVRGSRG